MKSDLEYPTHRHDLKLAVEGLALYYKKTKLKLPKLGASVGLCLTCAIATSSLWYE